MNRFAFELAPHDGQTLPCEQALPHLANMVIPDTDEATLRVFLPKDAPCNTRLHVSFRVRITDSVKYSSRAERTGGMVASAKITL